MMKNCAQPSKEKQNRKLVDDNTEMINLKKMNERQRMRILVLENKISELSAARISIFDNLVSKVYLVNANYD